MDLKVKLSLIYSRFHRQAQVTQRHHALQPKPNYFVSDCCRALLIAERYKKNNMGAKWEVLLDLKIISEVTFLENK